MNPTSILAIAIGLGGGWGLTKAGVQAEYIALAALIVLIFWHRVVTALVGGLVALGHGMGSAGLPLFRLARWITAREGVRDGAGGWLKPDDLDRPETLDSLVPALAKAKRNEAKMRLRDEAAQMWHAHNQDTIWLVRTRRRTAKSHLGGLPQLPETLDWPAAPNGEYLHFVAMLDLSELPRAVTAGALPFDGVLFFFLDLGDGADMLTGRVLFAAKAGPADAIPPEGLLPLHPSLASVDEGKSLRMSQVEGVAGQVLDRAELLQDLRPELLKAVDRYDLQKYRADLAAADPEGVHLIQPRHYRYAMVGGPALDIPNPTGGGGVKLLQLDSDEGLGLIFGDMGVVEFWIDEEELRAGNWQAAWAASASC